MQKIISDCDTCSIDYVIIVGKPLAQAWAHHVSSEVWAAVECWDPLHCVCEYLFCRWDGGYCSRWSGDWARDQYQGKSWSWKEHAAAIDYTWAISECCSAAIGLLQQFHDAKFGVYNSLLLFNEIPSRRHCRAMCWDWRQRTHGPWNHLCRLEVLYLDLSPLSPQVAQVAAKTLGIPLELVKVKPSNTLTNPNGQATGGSITSELNCLVSYILYQMLTAW